MADKKQVTVIFHDLSVYKVVKAAAAADKRALSNFIVCILRKRFARKINALAKKNETK